MELLVKDGQFGLNSEVFQAFRRNQLVKLPQIVGFGHVSQSSVASFSHVEIILLHGQFGKCFPVCLRFGGQIEGFQDVDGSVETLILERGSEFDQSLVELVRNSVVSVVNEHLSLLVIPVDTLNIALDRVHRHFVWLLNRVPHAEI